MKVSREAKKEKKKKRKRPHADGSVQDFPQAIPGDGTSSEPANTKTSCDKSERVRGPEILTENLGKRCELFRSYVGK